MQLDAEVATHIQGDLGSWIKLRAQRGQSMRCPVVWAKNMAGLGCGGHGYKVLDPTFGEEMIINDRGLRDGSSRSDYYQDKGNAALGS
jgi:hypothetical protein